ncbi:hypothetical protein [Pseudomonas sp. SDO52101_S400]
MPTNDFLPFGNAVGANVMNQTDYLALAARSTGFVAGTAKSAQLNKAWRQSSIISSMLAQFIVDQSGQNAVDDGSTSTLEANLLTAIRAVGRQTTILPDTGSANAYAAVNSPALTTLPATGYVQRINIANANTGAATYAPDGLAAKPIYGLGLQPLQGGELPAGIAVLMYLVQPGVNGGNGAWIIIESLGGSQQVAPATKSQHAVQLSQAQSLGAPIQSITASVAANALTVGWNPTALNFRSPTLNIGTPVTANPAAALSLVVPSGATLGTASGQQAQLILLVAYNGGTPVLCITNMSGALDLSETNLISPTTISAGATSAGVIYSASAVSANSPYRVVGYILITEATAGTWATAPTLLQGNGGQALAALQAYGSGQTWQNVLGSRVYGTTYVNATPRTITVNVSGNPSSANTGFTCSVTPPGGPPVTVGAASTSLSQTAFVSFEVPVGWSYVVVAGSTITNNFWAEYR